MEKLSEELKNEQYYLTLLDALIEENDMELKNRLQKGDLYTQFIQEQSKVLMENTIVLRRDKEVSFLEASQIVIKEWKEKTFQ
ncbi:hypothetical protein SAMN05428642_105138 [Flaviramulus basaltis]|uniref:Uncharacterized protein n=1 Tax=Flaviramulus basaltis TaxID=369401 RepID=A0A1K2IQZ8_9FLAO|nr:hypothetical protein [Flaviramulus basaltis]SFZ94857.1 hypothetical protein SAMN05428642_105138 [Flaviramulus basaltis]